MRISIFKIISIVVWIILLILAVGYAFFYYNVPSNIDKKYLVVNTPKELINKTFKWEYNIGWAFKVKITKNYLHWDGIAGDFKGMSKTVYPIYSKLDDKVYFISWRTPFIGMDSLVLDLANNTVIAHSKGNNKLVNKWII